MFSKDFVVFEAKAAVRYEQTDELRKLSTFAFTPNFVFLDSSGRKVLERRGFSTPREARAIHELRDQAALPEDDIPGLSGGVPHLIETRDVFNDRFNSRLTRVMA